MLLQDRKIILASGSPRRINILKEDGIDFEIIKPSCEENINTILSPEQTVMALSLRKGLDVYAKVKDRKDGLIIACDTIVALNGRVIGKPVDEADAFNILSALNGQRHEVWSGVCLIDLQRFPKFTLVFSSKTDVYFKSYSDDEIKAYIATGEPMDKAGAYAIQGEFGKHIDHIEGDYNNVVGFPYQDIKSRLLSI